MRYLGKVLSLIDVKENPHICMALERVILVKSLKHVFKEIIRKTNPLYISGTISHVLNCIFGCGKGIQMLESGEIKFEF
jgi:hypothetical protein